MILCGWVLDSPSDKSPSGLLSISIIGSPHRKVILSSFHREITLSSPHRKVILNSAHLIEKSFSTHLTKRSSSAPLTSPGGHLQPTSTNADQLSRRNSPLKQSSLKEVLTDLPSRPPREGRCRPPKSYHYGTWERCRRSLKLNSHEKSGLTRYTSDETMP